MKLKGIHPFEQHIEKIILAGGVLAVGGIVGWQIFSAPVAKLGTREVSPGEVDGLLEDKARALQAQLRGDSSIAIPTDGVLLAAPTFADATGKPVAPAAALPVASPSFASALVQVDGQLTDVWYYEPQLASLTMQEVMQTADALTAESAKRAVAAAPSLATRYTDLETPQDVVWTTPVARIDVKGMRAELARSEPGATPPRAAIPSVWYMDTPFVVDVVFERREVKPGGAVGPAQTVPAFSSRDSGLEYRARIVGAEASLRDEVFAVLGDASNQVQILQMPFYETVNNAFVSPTIRSEEPTGDATGDDAGNLRRVMQLKTQLESKKRAAQRTLDTLTKLGGRWSDTEERGDDDGGKSGGRDRGGASGGGGGGGGGGLGGGGSGQGRRTTTNENAERERARTIAERKTQTRLLVRLESEIAALEASLVAATGESATPTAAAKLPSLVSDDDVLVWGHDLEVEPGHTYQYRAVAQVYNPFFARGNQLIREQDDKQLAQVFALATRESEWSAPVTVSPRVRFFVTQANAGSGQLGMGTAQVEVYRLVSGQWRRSEMQVQPGERIGRMDDRARSGGPKIDFTTDYYIAGIVEDIDAKSNDRTRKPAFVIVRSLDGGLDEVRVPDADQGSIARIELREQAAAAAETPAAKPPVAGGTPGAPAGGGGGGGLSPGGGGSGRP